MCALTLYTGALPTAYRHVCPCSPSFCSCSPASPALVIVVLRIAVLIPAPFGIYALHSPSCLPAGTMAQAIRGRSVMGWSSEAGCVDPMSLCIAWPL